MCKGNIARICWSIPIIKMLSILILTIKIINICWAEFLHKFLRLLQNGIIFLILFGAAIAVQIKGHWSAIAIWLKTKIFVINVVCWVVYQLGIETYLWMHWCLVFILVIRCISYKNNFFKSCRIIERTNFLYLFFYSTFWFTTSTIVRKAVPSARLDKQSIYTNSIM